MEEQKIIHLGSKQLRFDKEQMVLHSQHGSIKLDRKVSLLLEFFLERQGRVVTRSELIEGVWQNSYVSNDAINRAVSVLRKALGGKKDSFIVTLPKVGYRFSIPSSYDSQECTSLSNPRRPSAKDSKTARNSASLWKNSNINDKPARLSLSSRFGARWLLTGFLMLLLTFCGFYLWQQSAVPTVNKDANSVTHLAILPFRNLTRDQNQKLFTAGLTEEVINNLARIDGMLILDPGASYQDENGTLNLQKIKQEVDAEFVLSGNVLNDKDTLRVSVRLTQVETGQMFFSTIFERKAREFFIIQDDLSQQIGAALNLTLRKNINLYSEQIEKLDFVAIEQLMIARAKIMTFTQQNIEAALSQLDELNTQYPETPEILGLLAFGSYQLNSSTNIDVNSYISDNIKLAEKALSLDPTNLDALYTLANIYIGFPDWRDRGHTILKQLLEQHPGKNSVYLGMLFNFNILNPSCRELVSFIQRIPQSIFTEKQMAALHYVSEPCHVDFVPPKLSRAEVKDEILWFTYNLYLSGDDLYWAVKQLANENPNSRYLAELYDYQVFAGAYDMARSTEQNIIDEQSGTWRFTMDTIGYLFDISDGRLPSDYLVFLKQSYRNASLPGYASAIIKQARLEKRPELVKQWVAAVPKFPITIQNRGEAMGLAFLLRYAGEHDKSAAIARRLHQQLDYIWRTEPESYHYWNMAPLSFLSAIYQDDLELAQKVLDERFPDDYEYWFLGLDSSRESLLPWRDHSVVKDYLSRIATDQNRFRQTL